MPKEDKLMTEDVRDTRRAFLGKAVFGGFVASLPILNNGSAKADDYKDCLAAAYNDYFLDLFTARSIANPVLRAAAIAAARANYAARVAACAAMRAGLAVAESISATANWIAEHPGAVIGTIVIIGGVAFVVSTGGSGALILISAAL